MKTLSNTLETLIEWWDDPGDYPSGAGAGPLPSYQYFAGMEGEVKVELEQKEVAEYNQAVEDGEEQEWIQQNVDPKTPEEVGSVTWEHELKGNVLTLWSEECEADPDYQSSILSKPE